MNNHIYEDYKDKYEIIKEIGKGINTIVYEAKSKINKETRAIKVINLIDIKEDLQKEYFKIDVDKELKDYINKLQNEIQNMKKCAYNNDNSIKFFEYFQNEYEFAIVLELCDYSLTKILIEKKDGFSPREIYKIINQLNNTFKIMKKNKIVHRDLKPDNILIKYENEKKNNFKVKLGDYGISTIGNFTKLKTHIGTLIYMAPEIMKITEENNYDYKCDLWSIGIIIYQLFFKETPYNGKTEVAMLNQIEKNGLNHLKKTNDEKLDDLINKLLLKEPEKRLSWEDYFNHPFFINNFKGQGDSDSESFNENKNDDMDELLPYRPELENVICQKITLLIPPSSSPYHPPTVYFMNDPKINDNNKQNNLKIKDVDIIEKKYMLLYKAYKNTPLCLAGPMKYNGIIRSELFDNANIIWKLKKRNAMYPLLKSLNKYQKFNHFPMTYELSRKDNLYNNYYKMKIKFPNEYNYMPDTYIFPKDYDNFMNEKIKDFNLNDKTKLWILKPCSSSRGRNIRLLTDIENIPKKNFLASHYIYNPHLINEKKYDLRIYVLVTGFCPLKIYLFNNGMARFSNEKYDLNPEKMSNNNIHLTDFSINKISPNEENYYSKEEFNNNEKCWTLYALRKYFEENNLDFKLLWLKIKDIIIKAILSITDIAIPLIKSFQLSSGNLFELYGLDIILDESLNPWLLEVNLNPALNCDSQLDLKVKSKLLTDIFNIIGAIPFSHDGKFTPMDKPNIYKDSVEEGIIESLCEFERPSGDFERIFPLKNNIEYYSQFISNPEEENLGLWKKMRDLK